MILSEKMKNSIVILYLLEKMDVPLPVHQIEQAALSHMDYFSLNETIHDLIDIRYIEGDQDENITRYSLTEEGIQSLEYFEKQLPGDIRSGINDFVIANRQRIKRDYETTATYFKNIDTDDYVAKCALYEDDAMLIELNITVVSVNQAKLICDNWKSNITKLYGSILENLINTDHEKKTEG